MGIGAGVLWVSAAATLVAAASLTVVGSRQPAYRGWRWWLAALWSAGAGVALAAGTRDTWLQVLAQVLMLQWPIVLLVGLRRFHARLTLPAREATDWCVLAGAAVAVASGPLWPADGTLGLVLPAAAALLVHFYAACLLLGSPGGRDAVPLALLGVAMAVSAVVSGLIAGPAGDAVSTLEPRAVASALGAVVASFVVLTLVCQRTERQLRDSQRRLQVLANLDPLTQVPNRRHFQELATLALRSADSACLLTFDIDHFKRINDDLGHAAGDRALRLVSRSVLEELRAQDVAGRQGGDEFVLLLRDTGARDASHVASRIVMRLQAQALEASLPPFSLSFGVVRLHRGEPLDSALRRADQALYEAKRQGRSRVVTADGDEDRPVFSESRRLGLTALG